jgi:hypothetical protein
LKNFSEECGQPGLIYNCHALALQVELSRQYADADMDRLSAGQDDAVARAEALARHDEDAALWAISHGYRRIRSVHPFA